MATNTEGSHEGNDDRRDENNRRWKSEINQRLEESIQKLMIGGAAKEGLKQTGVSDYAKEKAQQGLANLRSIIVSWFGGLF